MTRCTVSGIDAFNDVVEGGVSLDMVEQICRQARRGGLSGRAVVQIVEADFPRPPHVGDYKITISEDRDDLQPS